MEIIKGDPLLTGTDLQNEIERYFENYIIKAGYSTQGAERNKIPTNFYRSIFRHIYTDVFKANNINTLNPDTLDTITETYINLCSDYAIATMMCFFADYIGVHNETIRRWCDGDTRTAIYRDIDTGYIIDNENYIPFYKSKYPDCKLERILSPVYCEIAKKIKALRQDIVISKSLDFQNGILMDLNNGRETGTEYNQKRALETAQISNILAINDLPTLSNTSTKQIETAQT